jgi:predicted ATPase/class 3 adenylate cyclase
VEAQAALELPVRIGIHTGEAEATAEGYVGVEVHRAARICAVAHGGQVVVSGRTHACVDEHTALCDLGLHRLKDLAEPVRLYQVGDAEFPPLRSLNATNLPVQPNALVGRERELDEVTALLRDGARLVTLTGPGGTGKTRLAIQAAAELVDDFPDGVYWVPLAALRDPQLVAPTIEQTLGANVALSAHIGESRMLLLLDNLEQVIESAAALGEAVSHCPNLKLLVTSRALLRVQGERQYQVPPLVDNEAIALFRARALNAEPEDAVAKICRRLDGLPLAVELAAARTQILPPEHLLDRLERRLPLLTGGPRDAPQRQRTLRATVEWSFDLLTAEERRVFIELAVFAGFTLESAEAVCNADLDTLQALSEHSLVRQELGRFTMLETIREFAEERLDASDNAADVRRRHAEFMLELARSAHLTFEHARQHPEIVAPEINNLRAAIAWAQSAGDVQLALEIALALEMYWVYTNPEEGMRSYRALLASGTHLPLELRAHVLRAIGSCANPAGEDALAERCYQESYDAFEALGDERGIAHLLLRLSSSALYRGDPERTRELGTRSLETSRRVGDRPTEALALWVLGEAEQALGNDETGIDLIRQSADLAGEIGFVWQRTRMLRRLADWAAEQGNWPEAAEAIRESLVLSREIGDRISTVFELARLARIAAELGDIEEAGRLWGAVEAEENRGGLGAWFGERDRFAAPVLVHDGPTFARGRAEGRAQPLEAAVEEALAHA